MSVRVLLVEDNPGDANLIRERLSGAREPFEVTVVTRLSEAKESVIHHCVDVILLDLGLPDAQGLDTLTKTLDFTKGIPIVVLTGSNAEILGIEAARMGAQDYLIKGEANSDAIERSIIYAVERKKAQESTRAALQSYADLVKEIPSGLLTFQFDGAGKFALLSWNPRAEQMLDRSPGLWQGMELDDLWPLNQVAREKYLEVLRNGAPFILKGERFENHDEEVSIDLRAFRIACQRLCVSMDDVTERVKEEELRIKAYQQIERNIEHFASLVDEIRNPNSVIIGVAERLDDRTSQCILTQAERIENIINRLDEQWIASEKVRQFLRRTITSLPLE